MVVALSARIEALILHSVSFSSASFPLRLIANIYGNSHFTDAEKENKLVQVVGPIGADNVIDEREAKGPAPVCSTPLNSILLPLIHSFDIGAFPHRDV